MSRLLKAVAAVVVALLLLLAASGFIIRGLLSGSAKEALLSRLSASAGVPVRVESVDFDLGAWYRLNPAVELRDVHVGNPPGYRSEALLTAARMQAQAALLPLFSGDVQVHGLRLEQPRFYIETGRNGVTNLEAFLKGLSSDQSQGDQQRRLSVRRVEIAGGEIHFAGTGQPSRTFHGIDLTLDDFASDHPSRLVLAARLYDGAQSRLSAEGTVGPLSPQTIPVEAKLTATVALAEIPAAVRREQFGELLADPGAGRGSIEAALKGDVYGALSGTASLRVAAIPVGPAGGSKLPLEGQAPATLTIQRLTSTPVVQTRVQGASLQLGSGRWNGGLDLVSAGGVVRGSSAGAIEGVDIDQFLSAFASSGGKISGDLRVPSYSLKFGGKNAAQIKSSLAGEARLEVAKGRVKTLDLLAGIRRALEGKTAEASADGQTEFSTLTSDLRVESQKLFLANLALSGPALTAAGDGVIGFDQSLAMKLRVLVTGRIAELLGSRPVADKAAEAMLPVSVTGSVSNPSVRPEAGKIAAGAVKGFFQDFLKRQLDRKQENKQ